MIILDTNVVSEPLKPKPDPEVLAWLDRQSPETLYISTISLAELSAGVEVLPAGKRRTALQQALAAHVLPLFQGRVLSFDHDAALAFGRVAAKALAGGNSIDFADCAIAAIATTHRYIIATRNDRDFRSTGVELINPWSSSS